MILETYRFDLYRSKDQWEDSPLRGFRGPSKFDGNRILWVCRDDVCALFSEPSNVLSFAFEVHDLSIPGSFVIKIGERSARVAGHAVIIGISVVRELQNLAQKYDTDVLYIVGRDWEYDTGDV